MTAVAHQAARNGTYFGVHSLTRPDGAELRFTVEGEAGGQALPDLVCVFIHGWQADGSIWAAHAKSVQAVGNVRSVRYDQRGHGSSTSGAAKPSVSLLAQDLAAVIRATTPPGVPVLLVGHSLGGMTVLDLAASRPELFRSTVYAVVLIATTSGQLDLSSRGHPPFKRLVGLGRNGIAALCLKIPRAAELLRDLIRPRPYQQPPIEITASWYRALMAHNVTGRLAALRGVDVHILVGEADRQIPPIHALRLAGQVEGAVVHVVPNAGHRLPTEQPEPVRQVLIQACKDAVRRGMPVRCS
ncbi:alpha/beta fold hydrolase [Streptomyces sp. NPDC054865]